MVEEPDRRDLEPEAREMKTARLYLCEGYDPFFGPIRDLVRATCLTEANAKFLSLHGIPSLHTKPEIL